MFVVQLPRGVDRDAIVRALGERGVQSKPYFPAIHLMSYYRERFGHREGEFPVCEDVAARSIALPFFPRDDRGTGCARGARRCARCSAARSDDQRSHVPLRRAPGRRLSPLNDSISFDWRLGPFDVEQSVAHAAMLAAQGIITEAERDELHAASTRSRRSSRDGSFPFPDGDEDIHMAIERRVTEIAGRVGGQAAHGPLAQ